MRNSKRVKREKGEKEKRNKLLIKLKHRLMIDPKKVNMNELPKKFCDGAIGAYGKEIFSFALTSGNNLDPFAATPQVMNHLPCQFHL